MEETGWATGSTGEVVMQRESEREIERVQIRVYIVWPHNGSMLVVSCVNAMIVLDYYATALCI